jgi:hydrogenase maturation protein HypF
MVPKAFPLPEALTLTSDLAEPERFTERPNSEVGLALGSDLKTALCISQAGCATLYQPIGDAVHLETLRTLESFSQHIQSITKAECDVVLCDSHPDYVTHHWAQKYAKTNACKVHAVQHHHAHLAALAAEHGYHSGREICGFVFDGTGYGEDGTSMGGEVLLIRDGECRRIGHLKHTLLPAGDLCAKHPAKTALAMLVSCGLAWDSRLASVRAVDHEERTVLAAQLERGLNCVLSSSMGRLFDAISSILDLCHHNDFESHAALSLEGLGTRWMERGGPKRWDAGSGPRMYEFAVQKDRDPFLIDPTPVLKNIVQDVLDGVNFERIAFEYHMSVATVIADISEWVRREGGRREGGNREIGITGGVFQNSLLVHLTRQMLNRRSIIPWTHQRLTPNDGSLGVGQAWVRAESLRRRSSK